MRIRRDEGEKSSWEHLRDFGNVLNFIGLMARLVWALAAFLWSLVAD